MDKKPDKELQTVKEIRLAGQDKEPHVLPIDLRRKRIFWALSVVFTLLLCLVVLLFVLMLNAVRPAGFVAGTPSPVANFQASFYGPAEAQLNRPTGVAISPQGEVYLSDTGNNRVAVFNKEGTLIRVIRYLQLAEAAQDDGLQGEQNGQNGEGQGDEDAGNAELTVAEHEDSPPEYITEIEGIPEVFIAPTSLAFASDGRWFAVDQTLRVVLFFDQHDYLLQALSFEEETPISVNVNFVGEEELLFITTRSGIVTATLDGEFTHVYMNWGLLSGQLDNPSAVVVFDFDRLSEDVSITATNTAPLTIVADALNNRVQAFRYFDTDPEVAWMFGRPILDPSAARELDYEFENMIRGNISFPVDMTLSPLGRLFVVDGLSSEVVVLDAQTGAFQYSISSVGTRDGHLYYPAGIDYSEGNIYVTDRFNDRMSVFEDAPPAPAQEVPEPSEPVNRWFFMLVPLLALLIALIRFLTLRMPRYVVDLSFLESLSNDDDLLFFVVQHFNSLSIAPGIESVAEKMLPSYEWKIEVAKEEKRNDIIASYPALDDLEAETVTLALKKRGRSYLLTASMSVERAANELGIKVLRFAEFRDLAQPIIAEEQARQAELDAKIAEKVTKKAAKRELASSEDGAEDSVEEAKEEES